MSWASDKAREFEAEAYFAGWNVPAGLVERAIRETLTEAAEVAKASAAEQIHGLIENDLHGETEASIAAAVAAAIRKLGED